MKVLTLQPGIIAQLQALYLMHGYEEGTSIKDNTHQRRGHNLYPGVSFNVETEFSGKNEALISRDVNKQTALDRK